MTKVFSSIVLIFFVVSCKTNTIDVPDKPDNLIPKSKMVDIIYDMSLINAAKGVNKKVLESEGIYPEEFVFTKHNIDSLQFAQSSEYYAYNLKIYEDIYNKVRVRLNKDKAHYNKIIETDIKKKDSISKAKRAEMDSLRRIGKTPDRKSIKIESNTKQNPLKKADTSQTQKPQ